MPKQQHDSQSRPGLLDRLRELGRMFRPRSHEVKRRGQTSSEEPRPVPAHLMWEDVPLQLPGDGAGPLYHRRYQVDISSPRLSAEKLMARIQQDISVFSPRELAHFKKIDGRPDRMAVGDKYDIEIFGPWNGSVRVADVEPTAFTFVTLEGHPEAGQIHFRIIPHPQRRRALRFQILSWARSRDMLVVLSYKHGKLGKEIQKNAWLSFCESVVKASGGRQIGEIDVVTEERDFEEEVVPIE